MRFKIESHDFSIRNVNFPFGRYVGKWPSFQEVKILRHWPSTSLLRRLRHPNYYRARQKMPICATVAQLLQWNSTHRPIVGGWCRCDVDV